MKAKALVALPRGQQQFKVWDPGTRTLKTMPYPFYTMPKALAAKVTLPAGMPLAPSMAYIETMDACDVERVLPQH